MDSGNSPSLDSALLDYARSFDTLQEASAEIRHLLTEVASAASIQTHDISSRPKSITSFEEKALKTTERGQRKYQNAKLEIMDCVAARVIFFTNRSRDAFRSQLERYFTVSEFQDSQDRHFDGYDSLHLIVSGFERDEEKRRYRSLVKYFADFPGLEIQLRSVAAHAWAAFSHDTKYKSKKGLSEYDSLPTPSKQKIDQLFIEAGGMRRQMDALFNEIEAILRPDPGDRSSTTPSGTTENSPLEGQAVPEEMDESAEGGFERPAEKLSSESLRGLASDVFSDAGPSTDEEATAVVETLRRVGLTEIAQIANRINGVGTEVADLMEYPETPSAIRRLDDELLAQLGDSYVAAAENFDQARAGLLELRQRRLRGKFAIYSVETPKEVIQYVPAARALREVVRIATQEIGPEAVYIDGVVSVRPEDFNPSAKPRPVRTQSGVIHVATNLSRSAAEQSIQEIVDRLPSRLLAVKRAGDIISGAV